MKKKIKKRRREGNIMNKFHFIEKLNPRSRSIIFIVLLIIIGIIIGQVIALISNQYILDRIENPKHFYRPDFKLTGEEKEQIIRGYSIFVTILCVEIVLLIGLISVFLNTYLKIKSKYLIGFVIFVGTFLVKSISQLIAMTPLFTESIRTTPMVIQPLLKGNIGPFGIYFTIFEIIAYLFIYLILPSSRLWDRIMAKKEVSEWRRAPAGLGSEG